jgi:hypothetical protein
MPKVDIKKYMFTIPTAQKTTARLFGRQRTNKYLHNKNNKELKWAKFSNSLGI